MWCWAGIPTTSSTTTSAFTGWHTAYPDAFGAPAARDLPERCRSRATCCCSSASSPARPSRSARARRCGACCSAPRTWATAVDARRRSSSSSSSTRRPTSVREKGYRELNNLTPGYFGYSMLRSCVHAELYQALLQLADDMRMPIEGLHTETGPGVIEAALQYYRGARGGRSRRAVQDLHQGAGAAARADGDLHGQVVAAAAGPERPPARVARRARTASSAFLRRAQARTPCRTRCAGSSAASRR